MDRPHEGHWPEDPNTDEGAPAGKSRSERLSDTGPQAPHGRIDADAESHAPESNASKPDATDRPSLFKQRQPEISPVSEGDELDAPEKESDNVVNETEADASKPELRIDRVESIDVDPTRTIVFRRFDGESVGPRRPHMETERPKQADSAADRHLVESNKLETQSNGDGEEKHVELLPLAEFDDDAASAPQASVRRTSHHSKRTDPIRHSMLMLVTVFAMLAGARFVLPGIIEEVQYAKHRGQLRAEFEVAGNGLKDVSLDTLSRAYQMVSAAAGPCVVHIDIHRGSRQSLTARSDVPGAPSILISDQGSGVVVDAEGYILTNRHVIASSDKISVTLSDGRIVEAAVVGTDLDTDLAVLKVEADNLLPIPWGDSEKVNVGSLVWAIGSPFGLDRTVTHGIVSGKHRVVQAKDRYQDFMQSDVAVNPGNSGGPLVDSRGTLIGINTAIVGDTYQGVSFAIPSNIAKKIYTRLKETGSIERGWLGVQLAEVPDEMLPTESHRLRGAMIVAIADARSGAAKAGLQPGDVVVELDGERVRDVDHLMQLIGNAMAGTDIQLAVVRDDEDLEIDVHLGQRPDRPLRP